MPCNTGHITKKHNVMSNLSLWNKINKQWIEKDSRLPKKSWMTLIQNGKIAGKIIAGVPYIDADYFAANTDFDTPQDENQIDLLNG